MTGRRGNQRDAADEQHDGTSNRGDHKPMRGKAKPTSRAATAPSPSEHEPRSTTHRGSGLTREAVIGAALALVDSQGIEAFSLRGLARELDVYPTAIAWHAGSRAQLLADVVTLALADVAPPRTPRASADWRPWVSELMRRYRAALHQHPNIAPLLAARMVSNAGVSLDIAEATLAVLAGAGFAGDDLLHAYNAIIGTMISWVALELAPGPTEPEGREAQRVRVDELPVERYPTIAAHRALLANRAFVLRWDSGAVNPLDASFEACVDALLSGIAARHGETAGAGH